MKTLRTRHFHIALSCSFAFSVLFLGWLMLFGVKMAGTHLLGLSEAMLSLFALAAGSFVAFCFVPYFKGDRRWYSISTLLTVAFCIGSAVLWNVGGTVVAV